MDQLRPISRQGLAEVNTMAFILLGHYTICKGIILQVHTVYCPENAKALFKMHVLLT
jgi:hypothetical protein